MRTRGMMVAAPVGTTVRVMAALFVSAWLLLAAIGPEGWPAGAVAAEPAEAPAAERQRRVVAFVEAHQPELAEVLAHLEKRKPAEYARALEELDRSVKPLTTGKAKDPRAHELELRAWQARTRVELLGARAMAARDGGKGTAKDREDLDRQLREAIAAELDAKSAQLVYRKQRSAAWYDRQIDRITEKRDELVTARLKALLGDEKKPSTGKTPNDGKK